MDKKVNNIQEENKKCSYNRQQQTHIIFPFHLHSEQKKSPLKTRLKHIEVTKSPTKPHSK